MKIFPCLLLFLPLTARSQPVATDSLIIVSLGEDFTDTNQFSRGLQVKWVEVGTRTDFDLLSSLQEPELATVAQGKRVLLLIHGMGTPFSRAKNYYQQVMRWAEDGHSPPYDLVVGVVWPGYRLERSMLHNGLVFLKASPHARKSGKKLAGLLALLAGEAQSLDILTHSMGSKVALFALKKQAEKAGNLFFMAPSIGAKTLGENRRFGFVGDSVREKIIVFFSSNDPAFRSIGKQKMGHRGIVNKRPRSDEKFQNIDCSAAIRSHSAYWGSGLVFRVLSAYLGE